MTTEERILRLAIPERAVGVHYCFIDEEEEPMNESEKTVALEDLERAPRPEKEIVDQYEKPANKRNVLTLLKNDPVRMGWIEALEWAFPYLADKQEGDDEG